MSEYHDEASRFVHLLTSQNPSGGVSSTSDGVNNEQLVNGVSEVSGVSGGRAHLVPEDFVGLVQDVVDTHPGLTFLKEAAEFHSRYVHTVRIPRKNPSESVKIHEKSWKIHEKSLKHP